ncbi:MAG: hypothetical protein MRY32_10090 [Rickettsiales bacterium]|nr:hypothetical protein [Rickettsiales bacterium]
MRQLRNLISRVTRNEAGGMAFMGAAALMMLIIAAGSVIDISRFVNVKSKFKNAIDSALLSAVAVARQQDVNEVATRFFYANFPDEYLNSVVLEEIDVQVMPGTMTWQARARGTVNTMFGALIGFDNIEITHEARVAWDVNKIMEVVFTLDASASMCTDTVRSVEEDDAFVLEYRPDYACDKLNAMKRAVNYVIDNGLTPIEGVNGPVFRAGVIPFNHKVRLPNPQNAPEPLVHSEANLAKGDPNYFTDFTDAEPLAEIMPLTKLENEGNREDLRDAIRAIAQSPLGNGWTRSNVAVLTSALMLDPAYHNAFGGAQAMDFDPDTTDKIIIMMTDGANMGCCYAAHPEGNFDNQYLYLYEADNAHLTGLDAAPNMQNWAGAYGIQQKGLCDAMKDQHIVIYSVVYDVDDRDPGGQEIKDVYRNCASNEQFFFDVQDEEDLELAYKTISDSLMRLRIVY